MAFLDLELKLCGQHIECVRQFVFLGITIHETLNWDRYIDKIANKISRTLGVMNKLKHFLPKYTLKIMYSSLIAPHFNNNILLWGFNTHRLIKVRRGSGFDDIFCIFANMSCLCIHLVTLFNLPCKKKIVMEFFFYVVKYRFSIIPKCLFR